jgi:hypothetical protein
VLGGLVGAGGAAGAVYLNFAEQRRESRNITANSIYPEIRKYLDRICGEFIILVTVLEKEKTAGKIVGEDDLNDILDVPEPEDFPKIRLEVNRLECRELVREFYRAIETMRAAAKSDNKSTGVSRKLFVILKLEAILKSGLGILTSSDFIEIDDLARKALIESIRRALAASPLREFSGQVSHR